MPAILFVGKPEVRGPLGRRSVDGKAYNHEDVYS